MSDPSIEAAQRAWPAVACGFFDDEQRVMVAAAREALKPIRELHQKRSEELAPPYEDVMTAYDEGVKYVLDALAPLIYTTEELER